MKRNHKISRQQLSNLSNNKTREEQSPLIKEETPKRFTPKNLLELDRINTRNCIGTCFVVKGASNSINIIVAKTPKVI